MKKLLMLFSLLLLLVGLSGCENIGGNDIPLTKEEQDIIALRIFNSNKGITSVKFSNYRTPGVGINSSIDFELNGNPEDGGFYIIDLKYLSPEFETKLLGLSPVEWNESTQSYWFRGKYEEYNESNSPRETDPSKIKITYLDGSTNQ